MLLQYLNLNDSSAVFCQNGRDLGLLAGNSSPDLATLDVSFQRIIYGSSIRSCFPAPLSVRRYV